METRSPSLTAPESKKVFAWNDLIVFLAIFGLLWGVMHFGKGMLVHFDEKVDNPTIATNLSAIPYYAGRTLLRMWIAFGFSLLFTVAIGYTAAKSKAARAVILPTIDILQSVPVLGFLSATVTGFMALFPHSLLGVECASIFAIFTGQVWNMIFGFYNSMMTVPNDLQEAGSSFGLTRWQKFTTVEAPSTVQSLLWNSMISFGGGWFFVVQSEAISVMNKNIKLPGLGSFMAQANENGDGWAQLLAALTMVIIILASDQLVWRPLIAWSVKFKNEMTEATEAPTSWVYDLLRKAYLFNWLGEKVAQPIGNWLRSLAGSHTKIEARLQRSSGLADPKQILLKVIWMIFALWIGYEALLGVMAAFNSVYSHISLKELTHVVWLGLLTMARVFFMTLVASIIWIPIGVWIGFKPKIAKLAQPFFQVAASFPVNLTFPIVVGLFVGLHIDMNWGSILLIAMGTQWYILFNVIAGASSVPNDLKEVAAVNGLRGWPLWRNLILPAIFPYWVTGACTATGGAWNASIVAEIANSGSTTLKADGLGAYIAEVTARGDTPKIILSIALMSVFVVIMNKILWRRLNSLAERRFKLD